MGFGNTRPTPVDSWVGYRYNFNRWLAAEANYDMTANADLFRQDGSSRRVQHPPDHWLSCRETAELCQLHRMR